MSRRIPVNRYAKIPDRVRLERYRRTPEIGPRILFFTGGTALRDVSRAIKSYTYNSQHLVTPFDSGGSSAHLRDAFDMPSIGDLRNRLCSLADEDLAGNSEIRQFFGFRFPIDGKQDALARHLEQLCQGRDPLLENITQPVRNLVKGHLQGFCEQMDEDFDLRGASLGNLTLAGAYLRHGRDVNAVCYLYSRLLEVRGVVRATVNAHLDVCVELENGEFRERQHLFTGKESAPIDSPIKKIFLATRESPRTPIDLAIERSVGQAITESDLICFPMGSFYSSLMANLLPRGVGSSIKRARGPRIYVPNTGHDPEQLGMTVAKCTEVLLTSLRQDAGAHTPAEQLLDLVIVDSRRGSYPNGLDIQQIEDLGVTVLDLEMTENEGIHPERLAETLLSLA